MARLDCALSAKVFWRGLSCYTLECSPQQILPPVPVPKAAQDMEALLPTFEHHLMYSTKDRPAAMYLSKWQVSRSIYLLSTVSRFFG